MESINMIKRRMRKIKRRTKSRNDEKISRCHIQYEIMISNLK
jgi:hypothetical protein